MDEETNIVKQSGIFKIFGGMTWPSPCERLSEMEWRLRHGIPSRNDMLCAASVMSAYTSLINSSQKHRNDICRILRKEADIIYPMPEATQSK